MTTERTRTERAAEMYSEGETLAGTARAINCGIYHTKTILRNAGVALRRHQSRREEVLAAIHASKSTDSAQSIATRLGVSRSYVWRLRKGLR